jgi:hypothetical protein
MRFAALLLLAWALLGCRGKKDYPQGAASGAAISGSPANSAQGMIITSQNVLIGKVARVNPALRFVVINFPVGHLPNNDQHLNLFRQGLKVGEVKVTTLQYDDNVVADIVAGESEVGDEVRP